MWMKKRREEILKGKARQGKREGRKPKRMKMKERQRATSQFKERERTDQLLNRDTGKSTVHVLEAEKDIQGSSHRQQAAGEGDN